jgi:hypothetical protein
VVTKGVLNLLWFRLDRDKPSHSQNRDRAGTEMEFAPGPAFPDTVLADFPFAFTINFASGRLYNQMA